MNKIFFISVCTLCVCFGSIQKLAAKDSVVVNVITDTNIIRKIKEKKGEVYINPFLKETDSSRFVARATKPASNSKQQSVKASSSLFGEFANYINEYIQNYHNNHGARMGRIVSNNKGQFKLIENVMKRYNLPNEMKALAIIESALNCNAISPVGAVGPWQFMAGTAQMLGLRVDNNVDERKDFYKSTQAAAKYIKQLYGMFNDYLLVIASYNCGPAPVIRAINSGAGRSFWDIKSKLPKETQNHVMAFIATSLFLDNHSKVLTFGNIPKGIKPPKADFSSLSNSFANNQTSVEDNDKDEKVKFSQRELDNMAILKVKGNYKLNAISVVLDEDLVRLKRWNPDFDENVSKTSTPIHLRIPINKLEKFIISKDEILAKSARMSS